MIARILVAASFAALALTGIAAAQSRQSPHIPGRPLGIVGPQIDGVPVGSWATKNASPGTATGPNVNDNLTYQGGPVMRTNTVYTIFWTPSGYGLPAGYKTTINQFFQDVAADSGKTSNVYGSDVQYDDTTGLIQYASTYAGSANDTHAYPAGDCTTPLDVVGTKVCMSDTLLQKEIKRFADSKGWPHGANTEFFLYTPRNVETCFLSDAQAAGDPFSQACAYDYYCAYHNSFVSTTNGGEYIYGNMPFPNQTFDDPLSGRTAPTVCVGDAQGFPNSGGAAAGTNGAAADEVINVTSHEHNESITDPAGDAWWVDNEASSYVGQENGDLCSWYFPAFAVIGGSGDSAYNQVINGNHYFVQGEWSNASATGVHSSGCVWHYDGKRPNNSAAPAISGSAAPGQTLTGTPGTWTNTPTAYTYTWERCDTLGANCATITWATTSATSNTYVVRAADRGHTMRLKVAAKNSYGTGAAATSDPTPIVVSATPANSTLPTITGTTSLGHPLTGHAGTWTNSPTSYTYNWFRCSTTGTGCVLAQGKAATTLTDVYTVTISDVGHKLKLRVKATNAVGDSPVVSSALTATIT